MRELEAELHRLETELEETNRGVVALYAELDERDRRKDEFLATLAHELRNPLAAVSTAIHGLEEVEQDVERSRRLRHIAERQIQHLARLVDDLLDVSRITTGKIELRREAVDLRRVARRAIETSVPLVEEKGHRLDYDLGEEPLPVRVDSTRIEQVVGNLLTNAAKYTPSGGHVRLEVHREGDRAVLAVEDDGVGIPEHKLDSIFHLFTQLDASLDRSRGGLGIGLTLVRKLVEMHGGDIRAESDGEGEGSRFILELDLVPGEAMVDPDEEAGETTGERPASVLIVEDNEDAREALALLLEQRGHEVGLAADGYEGVELALSNRFDAALVDIGLPGLDGFEVARRIRRGGRSRHMTLFAVSGYGQEKDRESSREVGFDRHLVKPVDPQELFALLDEVDVAPTGRAEEDEG